MSWELLLQVFLKEVGFGLLETLSKVDWATPVDPVVAKEIEAAKTKEELRAAVSKLRSRVTKND